MKNKIKTPITVLVGLSALSSSTALCTEKPNIIVIVADDLGYGDVGFHGSYIKTPNINKIAREGVALESFYCCPVSSPTRAGIMTGRYPIRFGMMRSVVAPSAHYGINTNEKILPKMLKEAGYEHTAAFGKWHLGCYEKQWQPQNRGFDLFIGCYNGAINYFDHKREGELDWHKNEETLREDGYVTDLIGKHASEFIASVPKDESYFIYVPFTAPHTPIEAKKCDIAKYKHKGKSSAYAAMVDCLDQNIGKILDSVEERGDMDNTFILFLSDNGGASGGSNKPMRGKKFDTYEGGIRVVAACQWKAGGISGGKVINDRMGYIDIYPTLKALAYGSKYNLIEDKNPLDGVNVLHLMQGEKSQEERIWFTYIDQRKDRIERMGVNFGDWKLVIKQPAPDNKKANIQEQTVELYKLSGDHTGEEKQVNNSSIKNKLLTLALGFLKNKKTDQIMRKSDSDNNTSFRAPVDWEIN